MVSYGLYYINDEYENSDTDLDTADKDILSVIPKEETVYSDFDITGEFLKNAAR